MSNYLRIVLFAASWYLAGRLHQWLRTTTETSDGYRRGYNESAMATFSRAVRLLQPASRTVRGIARVSGSVRSTVCSSHSAEDRESQTTRINPGTMT